MLYGNLGVMLRKLLAFVMNRQLVLEVKNMVELLDMDGFNRDEAIKVLFLNNSPNIVFGKILTIELIFEDRLPHYTIMKCILPRQSNITNLIEEEIFLL